MSGKFFSIITPVFNGVTFIEETIKSIIGQTFKDFEYIIVDGNSTDGTQNIIDKHSSKIDKFISEKDNGMYDAIDKGIKLSNGKYILWVNSDDILADKNSLQNLSNYLNKVELNGSQVEHLIFLRIKKKFLILFHMFIQILLLKMD